MPGTSTAPAFTFNVDGSPYDPVAANIQFGRLVAFSRDGIPALDWTIAGGPLPALPDPFVGKVVELLADEGSGSGAVSIFKGRCEDLATAWDDAAGWVRGYSARGLAAEADRVPVTNPADGTDAIRVNLDPSDPIHYRAALAGRSQGQIFRYVLESSGIAAAWKALGIGGYGPLPSSPAVAHTTLPGGGSVTVVVDSGGSGYASGSPPAVALVGGGGTYTSATATVSGGGAVTGVTVSGASGYTSAPEVWISPLPLATLSDLAALTVIPPHAVTIQGEGAFRALQGTLRAIAPNHWIHIGPDALIRVLDQRTFTPTTLTMGGSDRVDVAGVTIRRSVAECYPRVVVRGGPDVVPVFIGKAEGSAAEDFGHDGLTIAQAKDAWSLRDFVTPGDDAGRAGGYATLGSGATAGKVVSITFTARGFGYAASTSYAITIGAPGGSGVQAVATATTDASGRFPASGTVTNQGSGYGSAPAVTAPAPNNPNRDSGSCSCPDSATVTITSANAARSWASNYWDWSTTGRQGTLFLTYSLGSGIDVKFSTRITSHPSLTAGGTCSLTVETPLPALNYDSYEIVGTAGGAGDVWRKYKASNTSYAGKLMSRFRRPVSYRNSDGSVATQTMVPTGSVLYSASGSAPYFECPMPITVDPDTLAIRTSRPVVTCFGTTGNLTLGGSATDGIPTDVRFLLAVNRGNLSATWPADVGGVAQYNGTSHTDEGLARTLTVTCPEWIDRSNQANMDRYAAEVLDTTKDAHIDGSIPLNKWGSGWLTPGRSVDLAGDGYDSPWDAMAAPVVECSITFTRNSGVKYHTVLTVSNRRVPFTSGQFLRPTPEGQWVGAGEGAEVLDASRLGSAELRLEGLLTRLGDLEGIQAAGGQDLRELTGS